MSKIQQINLLQEKNDLIIYNRSNEYRANL